MKKITILSIFLLIFSFSILIFPKESHAEINVSDVNIDCSYSTMGTTYASAGNLFNTQNNTFTADYSLFESLGSIRFVATTNLEGETFSYEWSVASTGDVIKTNNQLDLYKYIEINDASGTIKPLITVGTTRYVLKITNTSSGQYLQLPIVINITDSSNTLKILTNNTSISPTTNYTPNSNNFYFFATLPTSAQHKVLWYLKTPNSSSFENVSTGINYTFDCSTTINGSNGFGQYKIMAIATLNSKPPYYSNIFTINTAPEELVAPAETFSIKGTKVKNTQAGIEAFKYELSSNSVNINSLNFNNIHWYINGIKTAQGISFIYEPTTTDTYKVSVKYDNGTASLTSIDPLATIEQTPKSTNTYLLYIGIASAIAILGIILFVSIKISNKKRDVVW